jgi:hypothetical protein
MSKHGPGDFGRGPKRRTGIPAKPKSKWPGITFQPPPSKLVYGEFVLDWKETPTLKDMQEALKPFGLTVIEHPSCGQSDSYGFVISNRPLTKEERQELRDQR